MWKSPCSDGLLFTICQDVQPAETLVNVCVVVCRSLARMNLNMQKKYYLCAQTEGIFLQFNSRISTWPRRSHTIMHFLQRFPALKNSRISYFAAFYPYRKNHSFAPIIHLYCVFHSALSCARVFKVYSIQLVFAGVLSWLQATRTSSVWYFMELLWKRKYIFSISIWQHTQQGKPHIRFQTNR